MVSPSSGTVEVPLAYDGSAGAAVTGLSELDRVTVHSVSIG